MQKSLTEPEKIIYKKCSERVDVRAKELKLTNQQIYPADDRLVSKIRNNYVDEKNNPYLITDAVIGRCKRDGQQIPKEDTILHTLQFSSLQELLWGNMEEIADYILPLFIAMVKDNSNPYDYNAEIDSLLCAYAAFARCRSYYRIIYDDNLFPDLPVFEYGIYEDDILDEIDLAQHLATIFLFSECQHEILSSFVRFTKSTQTFKKLSKSIKCYFENELMPILREYKKNSHALGYRVEEIIYGDLRYLPEINKANRKPMELLRASDTYIKKLEKIQKKQMDKIYRKTFSHLLEY